MESGKEHAEFWMRIVMKIGAKSDWITFCVRNVDQANGSLTRVIKLFFKYFKKNIYKINLKCIFVLEYDHTPLI